MGTSFSSILNAACRDYGEEVRNYVQERRERLLRNFSRFVLVSDLTDNVTRWKGDPGMRGWSTHRCIGVNNLHFDGVEAAAWMEEIVEFLSILDLELD